MRGRGCGVSANEYSCAHGSLKKLWRSNSIFNLCFNPLDEADEQMSGGGGGT